MNEEKLYIKRNGEYLEILTEEGMSRYLGIPSVTLRKRRTKGYYPDLSSVLLKVDKRYFYIVENVVKEEIRKTKTIKQGKGRRVKNYLTTELT